MTDLPSLRDWPRLREPAVTALFEAIGTGGDEIWLFADNASDEIRCGRGLDFVILDQEADPGDTFVACENVFINTPGDDW